MTDYKDSIHLDHHYRGAKRPAKYISGNSLPIINIAHSDNSNSAATKKFVDESVNHMKNYADILTQSAVTALKNTFVGSVRVVLTDDDILSISTLNYDDEIFMEIVNQSWPNLKIDGVELSISNRVLVALPAPSVFNGIYTYNYSYEKTLPPSEGGGTISGYVFVRTDYLHNSFIPHNLQVPVSEGDVYGHTIFSHMTPTLSTDLTPQVGVTPIAFHKLGIADVHKVEGDNTGVALVNASSEIKLTSQGDINLSAGVGNIDLNATTISVPSATSFTNNLSANHIVLNSYGDQGTENPNAEQPNTLNGIYFRDPRPYLNQDQWGNYTTVNDNLCMRIAPVNGVGDTLVFSSYAGFSFMTQTNLVNKDPKSRIHLKNFGQAAVLEIDRTCDITSNDETGKHFFKNYIGDSFQGYGGSHTHDFGTLGMNLNKKYTYNFALYVYTVANPIFGSTVPKGVMELRLSGYLTPNNATTNPKCLVSTNGIIWHDGLGGNPSSSYNPSVSVILQDTAYNSPLPEEQQYYQLSLTTNAGEYYLPVFKRLY